MDTPQIGQGCVGFEILQLGMDRVHVDDVVGARVSAGAMFRRALSACEVIGGSLPVQIHVQ